VIDLTRTRTDRPADTPFGALGGMHISYEVPPPGPRGRYIPIRVKFALTVAFAFVWLGISVWLSIPWINGLAAHIGMPAAIAIVTMLAFIPGFVIALLTGGLLLDRQPPLKVASPTTGATVLIAARNEQEVIGETIGSLARQDYAGELRVILIDNASTDRTSEVARTAADVAGLDLTVLHEDQPGKNFALNHGLGTVTTDLVITVDADTLLQVSAVRLLIARLESSPPDVRAVAGAVLVRNSRTSFWSRLQAWDYFLAIASVKRMQGLFQTTLVAQGAFSLYRTEALREVDGWPDAIGEDIVLTWRLMDKGARIYFEPMAIAFTSAHETFRAFSRQRARWARGMVEGLRTIPPWRHQGGIAKVLTGIDLVIPLLDTSYMCLWVPGVVLACFGHFWVVGPMTIAVIPLTLFVYALLFHFQKTKVFTPLQLRVRRDLVGLVLFVFVYQFFMSLFSLVGYTQELTQRRRSWK
jgi:biofilm PGA synthesis N-glycosyltransferase PgaC